MCSTEGEEVLVKVIEMDRDRQDTFKQKRCTERKGSKE